MIDDLKTDLIIQSAIILSSKDGVPIFIRKKGDSDAGTILIKIDLLNGYGKLLRRNLKYSSIKNHSYVEYSKLHEPETISIRKIEEKIAFEMQVDQDLWVVEIEDKRGKNYFENF